MSINGLCPLCRAAVIRTGGEIQRDFMCQLPKHVPYLDHNICIPPLCGSDCIPPSCNNGR